jgi:prepilin-type N-terminal cleavage/methylation domain-containing protein
MDKKKAFTLIELIVVIAIISVLAAIIAPNAFKAIEKAKIVRTIADMKAVKTASLVYYADTAQWPLGYIVDSNHPLYKDSGIAGWDGPYIDKIGSCPVVHQATPSRPAWGYYYPWTCWDPPGGYAYACQFDLDNDGTIEVFDAVSVCVYGVPASIGQKIDQYFDGQTKSGLGGSMNLWGDLLTLYIGSKGG